MTIYETLRISIPVTAETFRRAMVDADKHYKQVSFEEITQLSIELRLTLADMVYLINSGALQEPYPLQDQPYLRP